MEFSGQDDDLLRAIELSKEEVERHPMLEPVKTERVSRAASPIDDASKHDNVSLMRKKERRQQNSADFNCIYHSIRILSRSFHEWKIQDGK